MSNLMTNILNINPYQAYRVGFGERQRLSEVEHDLVVECRH